MTPRIEGGRDHAHFRVYVKINTTVFSNEESLQKIESKLNTMSHNISKFYYQLNKAEKIYVDQQKAINQCITEVQIHIQNNKVIHSQFKEKLDKAILHTKHVATNLSKACDKDTPSKFQLTNSRINDIDKLLHDQEEEIQLLMDIISIYSQQKGQFAGTHSTVPNYNDTTELFPILKPMKHQSHQTQF
eukprot:15346332-Ditylum_brightwellii.AAC.1